MKTDGRTDTPSYRDARTHLKRIRREKKNEQKEKQKKMKKRGSFEGFRSAVKFNGFLEQCANHRQSGPGREDERGRALG